jgi:hypothetical protein
LQNKDRSAWEGLFSQDYLFEKRKPNLYIVSGQFFNLESDKAITASSKTR